VDDGCYGNTDRLIKNTHRLTNTFNTTTDCSAQGLSYPMVATGTVSAAVPSARRDGMMRAAYCAANRPRTSRQAGDSEPDCTARHCMIRPPPGSTPAQSARASTPHAERSTNSSSRGSIGRNTSVGGGAAAGAASTAEAPLAAGVAAPPLTAATALWQPADTFALFFSRHCSAGAPPVGTPAQTFG